MFLKNKKVFKSNLDKEADDQLEPLILVANSSFHPDDTESAHSCNLVSKTIRTWLNGMVNYDNPGTRKMCLFTTKTLPAMPLIGKSLSAFFGISGFNLTFFHSSSTTGGRIHLRLLRLYVPVLHEESSKWRRFNRWQSFGWHVGRILEALLHF